MNIRLDQAVSDPTGDTGLRIIRAICQLSPVNVPPLFGNDVPRVFGRIAPPASAS